MSTESVEKKILEILHGLVKEMGHERALRAVSLDALLDRDLGLDSLSRIELFHRVENEFTVRLPDQALATARTPRDILQTLLACDDHQAGSLYRTPLRHDIGVPPLDTADTLNQVLMHHNLHQPQRTHLFLHREDREEQKITYQHLFDRSLQVAQGLRALGLGAGEPVAIMLPTEENFFYGFMGILLAGGVPVPLYPPFRLDRLEEYVHRQSHILNNAGIRILLTFGRAASLARSLRVHVPTLQEITGVEDLACSGDSLVSTVASEDIALIQYTSGSTGDPRGVVLTHKNLLSNIRAYGQAMEIRPTDVGVSWLPLYHDMGLIGAWLGSLYYGIPLAILPPESFLHRPERWLWTLHYHQATLSAAPNFAYELCTRKIDPSLLAGLDLSSWRIAFNGAEPVRPETMERFAAKFSPYGFRPETFLPVYGLAESALALSFPPVGRLPRIDRVMRSVTGSSRRMPPADPSTASPQLFVSCGYPLPGHEIRILGDDQGVLGEREEGRLQFRGPSSMQGYFRNPGATSAVMQGDWVESGDLAYWADGELFVTGRTKDTIIKAGRNIYPQEIEEITGEIAGVRKGCVAALGTLDESTGTERLVIVAETREDDADRRDLLARQVTDRVMDVVGIPPDEIYWVSPGSIPKTSSGKIQRSACKALYISSGLTRRRHAVFRQIIRLGWQDLLSRCGKGAGLSVEWVYGGYVWFIVGGMLLSAYVQTLMASERSAVGAAMHRWARRLFRFAGYPIQVHGLDHLTGKCPCIFVANHASYMDVLVLLAVLPVDLVFVAKRELVDSPVIRTLIRKGGHLTVDRGDVTRGLDEIQEMKETLSKGVSVLIFPEGTTTRATGLRPFTMGAFQLAVEAQIEVCPVALHGTRNILRPDTWWPKRGIVDVYVGAPMMPQQGGWKEILRLRQKAKDEIAKHCGERVLDMVLSGPDLGR